jgi:hypothetical protein
VAGRYSFTTFEEYCQERWEMDREHARRLIVAAEAASKLHQLVDFVPSKESHVRALLALDKDDERAEVWQRADERNTAMLTPASHSNAPDAAHGAAMGHCGGLQLYSYLTAFAVKGVTGEATPQVLRNPFLST